MAAGNQELTLQLEYAANLTFQAQQRTSRLEFAVLRGNTNAEKKRHHLLGQITPVQITDRHQPTPYTPNTHDDRWTIQFRWVVNDYWDKFDELRTSIQDVTGQYIASDINAMNRQKDVVILSALGGSAVTGQTGTGTQALPNGSKIAVNVHTFDSSSGTADVGLTLYKLQSAIQVLEGTAGGLEGARVHCALPSKQKQALMTSPQVVSMLYRANKPLDSNELGTLLGITFHVYANAIIPLDANSDELVYVWVEDGLQVDFPSQSFETRISELPGMNYSWQTWAALQMGAVRLDDNKVVEIACDPTPVIVG